MAKRFLNAISGISAVFTGNVSSANPTNAEHLTTKEYVDAIKLQNLDDVNLSSLSDGEILAYDYASQKWVNSTVPTPITPSGTSLPEYAINGSFFYNTTDEELYFFFNNWLKVSVTRVDIDGGTAATTAFNVIADSGSASTSIFGITYNSGDASTVY